MPRGPAGGKSTRQRIIETALEEFAARGFDGAKVDRIARRARVNKAMLYYHFRSKAALYLEILREQFGALGEAVAASNDPDLTPAEQLRQFIDTIAREALARPHFPSIWLREIAEGGRHIDQTVVLALRRVLETIIRILADGQVRGDFRRANPLVVHISIVAPLMFFAASAPFRERAGQLAPHDVNMPTLDAMIAHVQAATLAVLADPSAQPASPGLRRSAEASRGGQSRRSR
jgi:AcrR family transcriptional regulator